MRWHAGVPSIPRQALAWLRANLQPSANPSSSEMIRSQQDASVARIVSLAYNIRDVQKRDETLSILVRSLTSKTGDGGANPRPRIISLPVEPLTGVAAWTQRMMFKRLVIIICCALGGFAFGRWLSPPAGGRPAERRRADCQVAAPVGLPQPERAGRVPFADLYRNLRSSSTEERPLIFVLFRTFRAVLIAGRH